MLCLINNKRAAQQYFELPFNTSPQFNTQVRCNIVKYADTVNSFNMAPLPVGWRYKRCWTTHLIKTCYITIGGEIIWKSSKEWQQMNNLIFENKDKELIFDYDADTRTILSNEEHEVIVEPINLKNAIVSGYGIPIICLPYSEVHFIIEFGSLMDCIESYNTNPLPLNPHHNMYMNNCTLIGLYTYLDIDERRILATRQFPAGKITKHNNTSYQITTKANRYANIYQNLLCSAVYIHITDINDNELPRQILKNIKVKINNRERHNYSGLQSRHQIRNNLPHPTKTNNKSQNLYYISYWPGRTNELGAEQGLNLSRIEIYTMEFEYENWVPNDLQFKISINHRTQNILQVESGMAGIKYAFNNCNFLMLQAPPEIPAPPTGPGPAPVPPPERMLQFPNTTQQIQVNADDTCMISHNTFREGESVDQCKQCNKVFTTIMLSQWLSTRNRHQHKCIHCSQVYNINTFIRGKAHIVGPL